MWRGACACSVRGVIPYFVDLSIALDLALLGCCACLSVAVRNLLVSIVLT